MSLEYAFPLVSTSRNTHGSGGFCNCDLNHVVGELHEFGRMQSYFSVWMCFVFEEGRALNDIHDMCVYIYIYTHTHTHVVYIMYMTHIVYFDTAHVMTYGH